MSDAPIYDELLWEIDYHENHGPQSSCIPCEEKSEATHYGCPKCGQHYGCQCRWDGAA